MTKRNGILLILFAITMALSSTAGAEMRPIKKIRPGIPPFEVIEKIVRTNDRMMIEAEATGQKKLPPATPYLTWLTDTDARIKTTMLIDDPAKPDTTYQIRTPGNQIKLAQGAIDYGIWQLRVPVLLITGNTDSHAIRLFMRGYKHLTIENQQELDGLKTPLIPQGHKFRSSPAGGGTQLSFKDDNKEEEFLIRMKMNVEANIDYQINIALKRYSERVADGRLTVVGSVLDLANLYGRGTGRHLIINVNNEKDPAKIKKMSIMTRLDQRLLVTNIGRGISEK